MSSNTKNARRFNHALQNRIKKLREGVAAVGEAVAEETLDAIQADTPRDTGRLAAGWQIEAHPDELSWILFNEVGYAAEVEFSATGGMVRRNTRRIAMAQRITTHKKLLSL